MIRRPHQLIAIFAAVALGVICGRSALASVMPSATVSRVGGATPYETAALMMAEAFPTGAGTVVIANGTPSGVVDGQLGNSLAGAIDCPMLFTDPGVLPTCTADAIRSLGATEALIVGGPAMVGPAVEASLVAMGLDVHRYGGANLYEDARAVALETRRRAGSMYLGRARLVCDDPAPDWRAMYALGATAYRAMPTFFTHHSSVPAITLQSLRETSVTCVVVLGSEAYVSDAVVDQLRDAGYFVYRMNETSRQGLGEAAGDFAIGNG